MTYQVFNSTLPIVKTEIDQFLKNYSSDHYYKKALSIPYFRQKLIAKILNIIPNKHIIIDECYNFADDLTFCIGSLEEQLLINKQIMDNLNQIVEEYNQFNKTHNNQNYNYPKQSTINLNELFWWIRFDTVKPFATYYFGPFDSVSEASKNCSGYLEDLMAENAQEISFSFQFMNPPSLTVINDMEDLQIENEQLLESLWNTEKENKYYENLFLSSPDSCLIINQDNIITVVNKNAEILLKTSKEKLVNQPLNSFLNASNIDSFSHFLLSLNSKTDQDHKQSFLSLNLLLPDKSTLNVSIKISAINNHHNHIIGWYLSFHDVTELQQRQDELYHQSRNDCLTNLPNRRSLLEFLDSILNEAEKNYSSQFAVLYLDINKFKIINDTFGHLVGDQVLITLAKRLITCVRSFDHVARLSGDEFMIVLSHIHSTEEARDCANRIQESLSNCFHIDDHDIMVSVSIGIVIGTPKVSKISTLLANADIAMYQAKYNGQLFSMYRC